MLVGPRVAEGKAAAHHPRGPAGAGATSSTRRASSSSRSACGCAFILGALSKRETHEYITHRLNVAGADGRTIFETPPATWSFATRAAYRGSSTSCATRRCSARSPRSGPSSTTRSSKPPSKSCNGSSSPSASRGQSHRRRVDRPLRAVRRIDRWRDSRCCFAISSSRSYRLALGSTIIGRTPDNDLQIRSKFVSRHHAQVVSDETQSVLEDLNSTNGVFIRSQRVKHQELSTATSSSSASTSCCIATCARRRRASSSSRRRRRGRRLGRRSGRRLEDDERDERDEDERRSRRASTSEALDGARALSALVPRGATDGRGA